MFKTSIFDILFGSAGLTNAAAMPQLHPYFRGKKSKRNNRNKCQTHGHLYRNQGTAHGADTGKLYMVGKCARCGEQRALIPAKRAETHLHPGATGKSRDHWLRPHIIGDWVYLDGQPAYHVNEHPKEHAA